MLSSQKAHDVNLSVIDDVNFDPQTQCFTSYSFTHSNISHVFQNFWKHHFSVYTVFHLLTCHNLFTSHVSVSCVTALLRTYSII